MGLTEKIFSNPLHPYTKMLMSSVPRLDKKWEPVDGDVEQSVSQSGDAYGCVYFDRCPVADKKLGCDKSRPALIEMDNDHSVACYRYRLNNTN